MAAPVAGCGAQPAAFANTHGPSGTPALGTRVVCFWGSFPVSVSVSLSASAPFPAFPSVRFWRSRTTAGVFVLSGVPAAEAAAWGFRLFVLGASLVELGQQAPGRVWFAFRAPGPLAARLAVLFPVPAGFVPLVVAGSRRVVSGAAERRALARFGVASVPCPWSLLPEPVVAPAPVPVLLPVPVSLPALPPVRPVWLRS